MLFCSPFDEALAQGGPPAVFLLDRDRRLRFQPEWTRDAWGRHPEASEHEAAWFVVRDCGSGFVQAVFVTSPVLLQGHPRVQARRVQSESHALQALAELGAPPIASEPWC